MTHKSLLARVAGVFAAAFATSAIAQSAEATSAAQGAQGEELQEVVVTGSHLQTTNFNSPTPVTVVSSEDIQQRQEANIADTLNETPDFLASNTDTARTFGGSGLPGAMQNTLNLRALGFDATLTLINGRRSVATNWMAGVDSNIVPAGLVDRVEIVTGGASAAYGDDAVAGVVNIILKNKMQGFTASAWAGESQYDASKQYTMTLAGGTAFGGDRGNVIAGLDYNRSDQTANPYGLSWGKNEIGTVTPSLAQRGAQGLPANYITTDVEPGTAAPGGFYQKSSTAAYTFDQNGNPVPFNQGEVIGSSMLGSTANYGYNTNDIAPLRVATSRLNFYSRVSFAITDHLTPFIEVNDTYETMGPFIQAVTSLGTGLTQGPLTISTANPFATPATLALLPAGATSFQIGRINTDFPNYNEQTVDNHRIVAGLDGDFGKGWQWEIYGQQGETLLNQHDTTYMYPALQLAVDGCNGALGLSASQLAQIAQYESLTGRTCQPFNPFGVGRNSASAYNFFMSPAYIHDTIVLDDGGASISGSLFSLPAGPVSVAGGAEMRDEHILAQSDPVSAVGSLLVGNTTGFSGGYNVKEAYAEVGIPILKGMSFAKSLDFNAAARRTDYQYSGPVTTWKLGLNWQALDAVRLRVTRSHDILAPNYMQLFFIGGVGSSTAINDIPNGVVGANGTVNVNPLGVKNTISQPIQMIGGNGSTTIKPQIDDSVTAGFVFQQGGFSASVDYYYIRQTGVIAVPGNQGIVNLCSEGVASQCQNITFNSSLPGGIQLVNDPYSNLNTQYVDGIDLEVDYRRPMFFGVGGNVYARALVNYEPENKTFNPLTGITTENAGVLGTGGGTALPVWGGNLTIGWQNNRVNAAVMLRGFSEFRLYPIMYGTATTVYGPADPQYSVTSPYSVNVNRFPGQIYVNPSVEVKITNNVSVFGNIDNLLNQSPPALTTNPTYDLIGRRFRIGARASF